MVIAIIYKIKNDVNDRIYVGSTIQTLNKRFYKHKTYTKLDLNTSQLRDLRNLNTQMISKNSKENSFI